MMTREKLHSKSNNCQSLEEDSLPYLAILFVAVVAVAQEDVDLCQGAISDSADFISFYFKRKIFVWKDFIMLHIYTSYLILWIKEEIRKVEGTKKTCFLL